MGFTSRKSLSAVYLVVYVTILLLLETANFQGSSQLIVVKSKKHNSNKLSAYTQLGIISDATS